MKKVREKMKGAAIRLKSAVAGAVRDSRGYSLAEVLATVAIIIILMAIVVMNVVSFQANLRQKELDAKAEVIYTAAQEQMTRIMASGRESAFAAPNINNCTGYTGISDGGTNTNRTNCGVSYLPSTEALPGDYNPDDNASASKVSPWQLCYITSADINTPGMAANVLFGSGGLEEELRSGSWVIEYDYKSLTVYSVFYSEDPTFECAGEYAGQFDTNYNILMRSHVYRLDSEKYLGSGKHVGYHGGGGSVSSKSFDLDVPSVEINNTEKLTATIKSTKPLVPEDLVFLVTLEDEYGNSWQANYTLVADSAAVALADTSIPTYTYSWDGSAINGQPGATFKKEGLLYTLTLTLDSLEGDGSLRFTKLYGSQSAQADPKKKLTEGSNIKMKVKVSCPDNPLVDPGIKGGESGTVVFNSLFGNETSGGKAILAYGRHVQNLDASSGVKDITSAIQSTDIDFSTNITDDELFEGWQSTYGSSFFNGVGNGKPFFKPIENSVLTQFGDTEENATTRNLLRLNINTSSDTSSESMSAGLFGAVGSKLAISHTSLVGATMKGASSGSTGGFVGSHSGGDLVIEDCQVYLSTSTDTPGKSEEDEWMTGKLVGGLVGANTGGILTITRSSASTVAEPVESTITDTVSGGLVGQNTAALNIYRSYADSYLTADHVGGLVGKGNATNIEDCYSAGYLQGTSSAAGLINGTASNIKRSYTLCDTFGTVKVLNYYRIAQNVNGSDDANVYYLTTAISADKIYASGGAGISDSVESGTTSSSVRTQLLKDLGGEGATWTAAQALNSSPYNLDGASRGSFTWPSLTDTFHYGDWAAGFQTGSLVYYEKYSGAERTYGFDGANVPVASLLNSAKVVGDGYGLVYDAPLASSVTVTVTNPDNNVFTTQTITSGSTPYETEVGGKTYYIYPLTKTTGAGAIVNTSQVNSTGYYLKATIDGGSSYFFNPHFALTVRDAGTATTPTKPPKSEFIRIRTARQLYNLSLYYDKYNETTKGYTFQQGRDIAYTEYEWTDFAGTAKAVKEQIPIGANETDANGTFHPAFEANYDGACHQITDVSFKTQSGSYVGMFGYVAAGATVKNTVLCTDYNPKSARNFHVQRSGAVAANTTVSMGVLAGYNAGTITNCAAAGYFLAGSDGTIHAYANSTVNVGGLVGVNAGTITDSTADSPKLRLSLFESTTYAGGFVGTNATGGSIKNCYALGAIDVADAKGGRAAIAGFGGRNQGIISGSYCATAIASSGDGTKSYGFAPAGGRVTNCQYLNGGTYSYIGRMYPYSFNTSTSYTSGLPIRYEDLKAAASQAAVDHNHSFVHSQTRLSDDDGHYPYRGVVKDATGTYVHYGNWQDDVVLGTLGIFYWEHEENGTNNGYHMTYLGSYEQEENGSWTTVLQGGTSLCTSHDDGGIITEYGYGVYVQSGQENHVSAILGNLECSGNLGADKKLIDITDITSYNYKASLDLQDQMKNMGTDSGDGNKTGERAFYFYAFDTGTSGSNFLYLGDDKDSGGEYLQNGTITLTFTNDENEVTSYDFTVSPFFANAMSIGSIKKGNNAITLPANLKVEAADDNETDYRMVPGTAEIDSEGEIARSNQYETRSLQQLQYINWNASSQKYDELVVEANRTYYPYLQYTTMDSNQSQASAERVRPARYWLQTHDLSGDGSWDGTSGRYFAPIAGAGTSSNNNGYNAVLHAWFGGSYNGQSYTIKNVAVRSESFYTGLFGVTAGANIESVIMYGDSNNAVIERKTPYYGDSRDNNYVGAYAIGGLVGVAYKYADQDEADRTISNCAISGYKIIDSSENQEGRGEVCIGGIIGVANVNLRNCSAVTDIEINCNNHGKTATWGNFIRVGGLVGGLRNTVQDCYSGGTMKVGEQTLSETYTSSKTLLGKSGAGQADINSSTHVFLAGIAGSAFSSSFTNFSSALDGTMTVKNCYTYMSFPTMEGTIRGITMIGSIADRYEYGNTPTFSNCYYLSSSAAFSENLPAYTFSDAGTLQTVLNSYSGTKTYRQLMIDGNAKYLSKYLKNGSTDKGISASPQSRTYEQMSNQNGYDFVAELNSGGTDNPWLAVTTMDYANPPVAIDGKFSYPSSPALNGKNYPFPTVIIQNDLTFGSVSSPMMVHVHYGDWPIGGTHWKKGRDSMDIFADMNSTDGSGWAYHEFKLYVDTSQVPSKPATTSFAYSSPGVAEVSDVSNLQSDENGSYYLVTIRALKEGTTNVSLNGVADAVFTLQVTANWKVSAYGDPTFFDEETSTLKVAYNASSFASGVVDFKAVAEGDYTKDYSTSNSTRWDNPAPEVSVSNTLTPIEVSGNTMSVTRVAPGTAIVTVTASYDYHGQVFQQQLFITVEEPGVVGLSNGTVFNESTIGIKETGKNKSYSNASKAPAYTLSGTGKNLYLYTTAGEAILNDPGNIKEIRINGAPYVNGEYRSDLSFYVKFDDSTGEDSLFTYLAGTVSYNGDNQPTSGVEVTVILSDGSTLKVTLNASAIPKTDEVTLDFAAGEGGTGSKQVRLLRDTEFQFATASDYGITNGNRSFRGWSKGANTYTVGEIITANEDMTFTALWSGKLTLVGGSRSDKRFDFYPQDGTTNLSDYAESQFDRTDEGWGLEGWYSSNNGNGNKVLEANGDIFADVDGFTSNGVFEIDGNQTLYAKWEKTTVKTVYERVTSFDSSGGHYLIANKTSGDAYLAVLNGNSIAKSETTYAISNNTIEDTEENPIPDSAVWVSDSLGQSSYSTSVKTNLKNSADSSKAIVNNGTNAVTLSSSTTPVWEYRNNNVCYRPKRNNTYYLLFNATGTVLTLNNNSSSPAYLYKKKVTYVEEETFDWSVNTLSLMNGSKTLMNARVVSPVDSLEGLGYEEPTNNEWELLGWYAEKTDNAEPVLEADGSAVDGLVSFNKDTVLYAKWRSVPKKGLLRLFSFGRSNDYEISWGEH